MGSHYQNIGIAFGILILILGLVLRVFFVKYNFLLVTQSALFYLFIHNAMLLQIYFQYLAKGLSSSLFIFNNPFSMGSHPNQTILKEMAQYGNYGFVRSTGGSFFVSLIVWIILIAIFLISYFKLEVSDNKINILYRAAAVFTQFLLPAPLYFSIVQLRIFAINNSPLSSTDKASNGFAILTITYCIGWSIFLIVDAFSKLNFKFLADQQQNSQKQQNELQSNLQVIQQNLNGDNRDMMVTGKVQNNNKVDQNNKVIAALVVDQGEDQDISNIKITKKKKKPIRRFREPYRTNIQKKKQLNIDSSTGFADQPKAASVIIVHPLTSEHMMIQSQTPAQQTMKIFQILQTTITDQNLKKLRQQLIERLYHLFTLLQMVFTCLFLCAGVYTYNMEMLNVVIQAVLILIGIAFYNWQEMPFIVLDLITCVILCVYPRGEALAIMVVIILIYALGLLIYKIGFFIYKRRNQSSEKKQQNEQDPIVMREEQAPAEYAIVQAPVPIQLSVQELPVQESAIKISKYHVKVSQNKAAEQVQIAADKVQKASKTLYNNMNESASQASEQELVVKVQNLVEEPQKMKQAQPVVILKPTYLRDVFI